jgi:Flp pilus assembly protein TadD
VKLCRIALVTVLGVLASCTALLTGCGADRSQPPTPVTGPANDPFTAGANRKPSAQTLYAMAQILATQGRDADCAKVLERCVQRYPSFLPAYAELAELHLRHGRVQQAMQLLLAGRKVAPNDARLVNNLGMCFILRHDPKSALAWFTRAAALVPTEGRYRGNMAMSLGLLGRYDESLALYRQVVSEADAHHNLGVLCRSTGDETRAGQEFALAKTLASVKTRFNVVRPATSQPASQPATAPAGAATLIYTVN